MVKAQLMGINTEALEFQESQMAVLADVRKKWHIPPAFSVEFVGYYLDRIIRLKEIKQSLQDQVDSNKTLIVDQESLRIKYDEVRQKRELALATEQSMSKSFSFAVLEASSRRDGAKSETD